MATKLFLRNTTTNGITDAAIAEVIYDMVTTAGSAADDDIVNTAASGTEIQWTQSAGGSTVAWISGRVPAGGFTLTTTDISIWALESNMNANCGGRYRVFKYSGGTLTELGGGPFNDGVEFGTAITEMTWAGNVTDTAFAENDRIVVKVYITNVGTMASGHTCTIRFNAADATQGDSFFNIAETVTFKAESDTALAAAVTGPALTQASALTTEIRMASAQSVTVNQAAALTTEIRMAGAVSGPVFSTPAAALTTEITMQAAVTGPAFTPAAALTTEIRLSSAVSGPVFTSASDLSAGNNTNMEAAVSGPAFTSASILDTAIHMTSTPVVSFSSTAQLTTEITLAAAATVTISQVSALEGGSSPPYAVGWWRNRGWF